MFTMQAERTWQVSRHYEQDCEDAYWGATAVVITDEEYPVRPAFSLLQKLIDDFITSVPKTSYSNPASIDFPAAKAYLVKYQDPKQADQIMKVQAELDETKIILVCKRKT